MSIHRNTKMTFSKKAGFICKCTLESIHRAKMIRTDAEYAKFKPYDFSKAILFLMADSLNIPIHEVNDDDLLWVERIVYDNMRGYGNPNFSEFMEKILKTVKFRMKNRIQET